MATIFDMREPRPVFSRLKSIASGEPEKEKIPSQEEEGEPEVGSDPKLGRQVVNYLEPRKGIDAPGDFRSCASCRSFVPERAFRAATTGNHCVLLGSFRVEPHANCSRYAPWPNGKPIESAIEAHALCCLNGSAASLNPYDVSYCEDHDHSHKCRGCRHYDAVGDADTNGPECEAFEELNRKVPNLFQVSESVDPDGGCSMWSEPVEEEM